MKFYVRYKFVQKRVANPDLTKILRIWLFNFFEYAERVMLMKENKLNIVLNEVIYYITVILSVFFMVNKFAIMNAAILMSILTFVIIKEKGKIKFPKVIIAFICFIIIILIQMIIIPSEYFNFQISIKEISRLYLYILVILIVCNIEIREKKFAKFWSIIFVFLALIAVFQFFKLFRVNEILGSIYGETVQLRVSKKYYTLDQFRSGTVFLNPNNYAKFILAYLALFLSIINKTFKKKMIIFLLFLTIVISLALSGSRTGFVVSIVMIIYSFTNNKINSKLSFSMKNIITLLIFLILLSLALITPNDKLITNYGDLRFLKVFTGIDNSLKYKFTTFKNILIDFNVINVFIGMGPFENDLKNVTLIDFDLGYIISFYGSIGIILYTLVIVNFFNYRNNSLPKYLLMNKFLILIFILFGFTGGMLLNLRSFTIYSTLIYANILDDNGG